MSDMQDNESLDAGLIAVIGMACRFPGANDLDQYWHNLRSGVESVQRFSHEALLAAGELPERLADPDYVPAQPVLEGFDAFDAPFWGFSPQDAAVTDPAHRLFLEVGYHALEHAGHRGLEEEGTVAVFASSGASLYWMQNLASNPDLIEEMGEFLVRHTGNDMNFLATRLSYELDLRGPSMNIQTACSSSLVAIHYAAASLLSEECDIALAGASNVLLPQQRGYLYRQGEIMSPDGHCRPFDAHSAGTIFGSGAGAVVLRRLADAQDDGDHILAVIRGSAINNDGSQKVGYLAPGVEGQVAAITEAQAVAGVHPSEVSYIEAHGTGTLVGDPIEVEALKQAFGPGSQHRDRCLIGSVKANIGHLGEAAGMASFIKAVLCLEHQQIPSTPNFNSPNPEMAIEDSPFEISAELHDWSPPGSTRICGVTALGAGGTNAHIVLEQAPEPESRALEPSRWTPLLLSAKSKEALSASATRLSDYLSAHPESSLDDVAYTLAVGRRSHSHRSAVITRDRDDAVAQLDLLGAGTYRSDVQGDAPLVFMFPGGGAQYPGMGAALYRAEPRYAAALNECFEALDEPVALELRRLLLDAGDPSDVGWNDRAQALEQPSRSLVALFATEYALAQLYVHWGAKPAALVGHSMGEYTAACLAGVMSVCDAVRLVQVRGVLFEQVAAGAMLSVSLAPDALTPRLAAGLSIAAINAPELCVASGEASLIDGLQRALQADGIECSRVHINVAAHSGMLDAITERFRDFCSRIVLSPPLIPMTSNLSGGWMTGEQATSPDYWTEHLRQTVRFADNVDTAQRLGATVLLEVGPGHSLASLARACGAGNEQVFSSMRHANDRQDDQAFALNALSSLWSAGVAIDWRAFWCDTPRRRVALPGYAFQKQRYWVEPGRTAEQSATTLAMRKRDDIGDWFGMLAWRQAGFPPPSAEKVRRWLVFAPATGAWSPSQNWLPTPQPHSSAAVVWVTLSDAGFHTSDHQHYSVDPEHATPFAALFEALNASEQPITDIVYAWSMDAPQQDLGKLNAGLYESFWLPFRLAKALAELDNNAAEPINVTFLTQDLWAFEEHPGNPLMAPLTGAARVIPRELSQYRTRTVDLQGTDCAGALAMLRRELSSTCADAQVLLRDGQRWTRHFTGAYEPAVIDHSSTRWVKAKGTYLISGGLGGIGLTVAEHLASHGAGRLLLLSRTGLSDPTVSEADAEKCERQQQALARIASYGTRAEVLVADVSSKPAVIAALREQAIEPKQIDGVFHAAGSMDDQLLILKSEASARGVLEAKVRGAVVLDSIFDETPLDYMVFFSSVASYVGLPGQIDYSAANAFLDSLAASRSRRCSGFSAVINWNAWRDVGMAADSAGRASRSALGTLEIHPALLSRTTAEGGLHQFEGILSDSDHWFIREHRVRGGQTLIAGTGLLEIAAVCLAQLRDGEAFPVTLRNVQFIEALQVDAGTSRGFTLAARSEGDNTIELSIYTDSTDNPHFVATGCTADHTADPHESLASIRARCNHSDATEGRFMRQHFMDFGPRWSCIDAIHVNPGAGEALLELSLAGPLRDDLTTHALHPALLDMAIGAAQRLIPDFEADTDFYVPFGYESFTAHGRLPAELASHVRHCPSTGSEFAYFDVTIMDPQGCVLVEVERFAMKRVGAGSLISQRQVALPPSDFLEIGLDDILKHAITPAEGIDTLDRVMRQRTRAQWVISSVDTQAWIDALAQPPKVTTTSAFVHSSEPIDPDAHVLIPAAETALAALENVRAVAIRCFGRSSDAARTVAFVVLTQHDSTSLRQSMNAALEAASVALSLDAVVTLDELVRDADGEIVREPLADPLGGKAGFRTPTTPTEVALLQHWSEALGTAELSIDDHFFELGGHSLLLTRLIAKVQKAFGRKLPLEQAYQTPTIFAWGALLDENASEPAQSLGIGRADRDRFKI